MSSNLIVFGLIIPALFAALSWHLLDSMQKAAQNAPQGCDSSINAAKAFGIQIIKWICLGIALLWMLVAVIIANWPH